jgi:succinate dehydrogenase/fumarate reductase flavoprotein subunit
VDIVVAGGGLAGLCAANRALELGARVTLLEKGNRPGGSLVYSSGYVWSYRDLQTFRQEAPGGEVTLQRLLLERLEPALAWLEGAGAPVLARETGNPLTFGVRLDPEGTVAALAERAAARGGRVVLRAALKGLERGPDGRVAGVRLISCEEPQTVKADAVILATGGFAANRDLVRRHIIRGPGEMRLRAHPWSTGDGFLAALEEGALSSAGLDEFYGRNLPAPPAEFGPEEFVEVSQLYGRYSLAINARGERYADEGADWSETALARATARQPGLRAWYLLDGMALGERVRERSVEQMVATARRVGGTVLQAGTLGALISRLAGRGVPPESVRRTLEGYGAAVAAGRGDALRPPRSGTAAPVQVPPFLAVEVSPGITHTIGGLTVDGGCRVLRRTDGLPLPGLYAAGVEVGGVATGGYASGLATALVLGEVAAESAVGNGCSRRSPRPGA